MSDETIRSAVLDVARSKPDAIAVICTNLHAAHLVEALERECGIPIYDTVATGVLERPCVPQACPPASSQGGAVSSVILG